MRSLPMLFALVFLCLAPAPLAQAQNADASDTAPSASASASKQEVNELRKQVVEQKKTIEELKAIVQKLADGKSSAGTATPQVKSVADTGTVQASAVTDVGAHMVDTVLVQPEPVAEAGTIDQEKSPGEPKREPPLAAGWNGEHFFIRSPDGQFSLSPYGYVDVNYLAYKGDGAPADTFVVRRARFGFQGNFGSHFDFALLTDANSTTGAIVRDVYLNVRIRPEFQIQAGQFKEPFSQETGIGDTNLDFTERGLQSLLYPCAVTVYRCPGVTLHGDISGGVMQWWAGAFNGRGGVTANVVNEPELVGRLRFYPWRKTNNSWLKEFAFGGSISHARSRGLSGDVNFSSTIPDQTYSFFPQLPINGPIERYAGEFTYIKGPYALRGEYVQIQEQRDGVGSLQVGGLGFLTLPGIGAKAWNIGTTYLLTGEKRPENGTPRVRRPLFGPDTPGGQGRGLGAWEIGARYSGIQANAPAANFLNYYTPGFVPQYDDHTDQISFVLSWYLNYWVKYQFNVNIDQLHQPSTIGQLPQNFYVLVHQLQFRF